MQACFDSQSLQVPHLLALSDHPENTSSVNVSGATVSATNNLQTQRVRPKLNSTHPIEFVSCWQSPLVDHNLGYPPVCSRFHIMCQRAAPGASYYGASGETGEFWSPTFLWSCLLFALRDRFLCRALRTHTSCGNLQLYRVPPSRRKQSTVSESSSSKLIVFGFVAPSSELDLCWRHSIWFVIIWNTKPAYVTLLLFTHPC